MHGQSLAPSAPASAWTGRSALLALAHGLLLASLYVTKPARSAMFLAEVGPRYLPTALVAVALAGSAAALLLARATLGASVRRAMLGTYAGLAFVLLGFFAAFSLLHGADSTLAAGFYVFTGVHGLLATSQLWLLAGTTFEAGEARRAYGVVGAGGIAGAIGGSVFTQLAVPWLGTVALLPVSAAMLAGAAGITLLLPAPPHRRVRPSAVAAEEPASGWSALRASPLLRASAPLVLAAAFVSVVSEVQLGAAVTVSFANADEKARFFASLYTALNVTALLVQLGLTTTVLRRAGVGPALLVLPSLLALGASGALLWPGLATVTLTRGADLALRHSLNKSAAEVLLVPVPVAVKRAGKPVLDSVVDHIGTGLGALVCTLLLGMLRLDARWLSVPTLLVCAGWLYAAIRARRAYIAEFRRALERRSIDPNELSVDPTDAATRDALLRGLAHENARKVEYALGLLAEAADGRDTALVRPLADHADARVQALALATLARRRDERSRPSAERLFAADAEPSVRVAALFLLAATDPEPTARLRRLLQGDDDEARVLALRCAVAHFAERPPLPAAELIALLDRSPRLPPTVAVAATALLPAQQAGQRLRDALLRGSVEAGSVAAELIGRRRALELVDALVAALARSALRSAVRAALVNIGELALPALATALDDPRAPAAHRGAVVRAMGAIRSPLSVELLLTRALDAPPDERFALLKALNRLRNDASLSFDRSRTRLLLERCAARVELLSDFVPALQELTPGAPRELLVRALGEKRSEAIEALFRVLGLRYSASAVRDAWLALASPDRRRDALELLDNLLVPADRALVMRWLDAEPVPSRGRRRNQTEALLTDVDGWLRACAAFALAHEPTAPLERLLSLTADPDARVAEAARWALARREPAC